VRRKKQDMGVSSTNGFALSALGAVLFIGSGCMAPVAFQTVGAIGGASEQAPSTSARRRGALLIGTGAAATYP